MFQLVIYVPKQHGSELLSRVGPGFRPTLGLSLSKCFGPISVLHTQVCYTVPFEVTIFPFLKRISSAHCDDIM